jgi:hypothetical protein
VRNAKKKKINKNGIEIKRRQIRNIKGTWKTMVQDTEINIT